MTNNNEMINLERLFKNIGNFFEKPEGVLLEIAQNSQRAGAKNLSLTLADNIFTAEDDGQGLDNPVALLCLADSHWAEEVMENQNPAGWGLFYLMAIAEEITYRSRFGTLNVVCDKFFRDAQYRASLLANIDTNNPRVSGFSIRVALKKDASSDVFNSALSQLAYFDMNITFNGTPIEKKDVNEVCANYQIQCEYLGNKVYISPYKSIFINSNIQSDISLIWYGIPISRADIRYASIVIDVRHGDPLTPVLPYRTQIKIDGKLDMFRNFIRSILAKWCIEQIMLFELDDSYHEKHRMRDIMQLAGCVCSQQELDNMGCFFYTMVDTYYSDEYDSRETQEFRFAKKGCGPLVSEKLVLTINGERVWAEDYQDGEMPILPPWTVTEIELSAKHPSWLKVEEREVEVKVDVTDTARRKFTWCKCSIECNRPLPIIAIFKDMCDGTIYYAKDVKDFYTVFDAVFNAHIYYDDGDTAETQERCFSEEIRNDMSAITGSYDLQDLLNGFRVTGIDHEDIESIIVEKTSNVLKITKTTGEMLTLPLAA